jgi:hypothetical protein
MRRLRRASGQVVASSLRGAVVGCRSLVGGPLK